MSLYNKYRPKTFEEMIGNSSQLTSLKNQLIKKGQHTFLFTGPAGCGKTTSARICADMLGGSIREINSSNNRGIDTAREIIDSIRYISIDGQPIIYIIDEAHKATNEWQNAMLKPLEDTPNNVYFFLCTTNPEKLLKTIKSRCSIIKLNTLSSIQIIKLLRLINRNEETNVSLEIIEDIADLCEGCPRKALVLFEQIIGMEDKDAQNLLNNNILEEDKQTIELCRGLLNSSRTSWGEICEYLKAIEEDPEKIRWAILGYMSKVLLSGKRNDKAALILELFNDPFYDSGKNGLILACYQSFFMKN